MKVNQEAGDARREMKKTHLISHLTPLISFVLVVIFHLSLGISAEGSVVGQFYPSDRGELSKAIDGYLKPYKVIRGEGELVAIIVPHAGYEYSGKVAGYAYKQLTNKSYDTVIIIGPSHYALFDGISILDSEDYSTPLGKVKIDKALVSKLIKYSPKIRYFKEAWEKEHSVDVQVPFLQKTLNNFKIVPVIMGEQTLENCYILANAVMRSVKDERVLIVASTDLSHYHTAEAANKMDSAAIDAISNGDVDSLIQKLSTGECEMCGYGPVITAMIISNNLGANSFEILKYADTGDVTGDKSSVVGYLSAAIYKRPLMLDDTERTRLLEIARKTLESYVQYSTKPEFLIYEKNLHQKSGVFVTLKKNEELRGCIGYIMPVKPLYLAVSDMTLAAAFQDPRFTAVTTEELPEIKIEISVLSPIVRVKDHSEIVVGQHGLYIINGDRSGLLLPQVAVENKWTGQQFLENICNKAELPATALTDPATQLYVFTADVFHEE